MRSRAVPLALSAEELLEKCPAPHCISPGLACQEHFRRSQSRRALSGGIRPVPHSYTNPPPCPAAQGDSPTARAGSVSHQPPSCPGGRSQQSRGSPRPVVPAARGGVTAPHGLRGPHPLLCSVTSRRSLPHHPCHGDELRSPPACWTSEP